MLIKRTDAIVIGQSHQMMLRRMTDATECSGYRTQPSSDAEKKNWCNRVVSSHSHHLMLRRRTDATECIVAGHSHNLILRIRTDATSI